MVTLRFLVSRINYIRVLLPLLTVKKVINLLKAILCFLLKTTVTVKSPPIVILNLTSDCNYKCIMCWQNDSTLESVLNYNSTVEMDFSTIENFLRKHSESICLVRLHGGEPLIYNDLLKILDLLNELKIPFNIVTNGSILMKELSDRFINTYCVGIGFSLDTANPETYKKIRTGGDFNVVHENIKTINRLKQEHNTKRPVLTASMCAFSINIEDMKDLVLFCSQNKIISLSVAEGDDLKTSGIKEHHLIKNHVVLANDSIRKASEAAKKTGVILRTRFPSLMDKSYKGIPYHKGNITPKNCLNLYTAVWILPDFKVIGCSVARNSLGNMLEDDFEKIWNSREYGYAQSRIDFKNNKVPKNCLECTYTGGFFS